MALLAPLGYAYGRNDVTLPGKIANAKVSIFCLSEGARNSASLMSSLTP